MIKQLNGESCSLVVGGINFATNGVDKEALVAKVNDLMKEGVRTGKLALAWMGNHSSLVSALFGGFVYAMGAKIESATAAVVLCRALLRMVEPTALSKQG